MKLVGVKEVEEALKNLDAKMQMALLRSFNRKALQREGIERFKGAAHSRRGKNNIEVQATPRAKNKSSVIVGPTSQAFIERFLEKGTVDRYTKRGAFRGSIKEDRQYDKVADESIMPIIDYTNEELGKEITKMLERKLKSTQRRRLKLF
jgi:hypothetical protein